MLSVKVASESAKSGLGITDIVRAEDHSLRWLEFTEAILLPAEEWERRSFTPGGTAGLEYASLDTIYYATGPHESQGKGLAKGGKGLHSLSIVACKTRSGKFVV